MLVSTSNISKENNIRTFQHWQNGLSPPRHGGWPSGHSGLQKAAASQTPCGLQTPTVVAFIQEYVAG
jgi:hypothetical protein